jgi:mannose-1-phosphate guanylyltransferase
MEPVSAEGSIPLVTVVMDVQWMDIGSWPAYGETLEAEARGNRSNTATVHLDSRDVLAVSDDPAHTIATIGCEDLIIIHTADATLVCPRNEAQRVKEIVEKVDDSLR